MLEDTQTPQADEPVAPAVPEETTPETPEAPEEKPEVTEPPKTEEAAQEAIKESEKPEEPVAEEAKPEETPEEPKVDAVEPTRQEKREARTDKTGTRFIDRIKREVSPSAPLPEAKTYDPLDLKDGEKYIAEDGTVKTDVLAQDRAAAVEAAKLEASRETAQAERERASQAKFFGDVDMESKILVANPKYEFLKNNEDERAQHINEQFALAVGYRVEPMFDDKGAPLLDPTTGRQAVREVVSNPNISYQKFVQELVDREDKMVEARLAEKNGNLESMQAKSGIKPGGGSAKTKTPSLDEIKDLSDDEWEKARPAVLAAHGVKPN